MEKDIYVESEVASNPLPIVVEEAPEENSNGKILWPKFKSFLLWFFIIEHIFFLILLLLPFLFIYRTYARTDFLELNDKASSFTPYEQQVVTNKYLQKYKDYVVDFVKPENTNPKFEIAIEEADLNSLLSSLKFDNIEKIYIEPLDENFLNIWIKTSKIPYPISAKTKLYYNYENKEFRFDSESWAIGYLTFPSETISFIEDSINENAWNGISQMHANSYMHIEKIESKRGQLDIVLVVDDKVKFTESIINSGSIN